MRVCFICGLLRPLLLERHIGWKRHTLFRFFLSVPYRYPRSWPQCNIAQSITSTFSFPWGFVMEVSPQTETLAVAEHDEMEEQHGTIHQKETVTMDSMQQVETKKKKQTREKRQKANNSEVPEKLLTELPFANVDIGALFDITRKSEKTVKKKRKRKLLLEDEDDDTSKKKTRANYFISIPISNPKILQDIQTFQNAVLEKDERLSKVMIPKGSFHITLFVMHLATEEEINLAISALLDCKEPVGEILQEKTLIFGFDGVSDFKNQVVYGKIIENDSVSTLKEMTDTLVKIFKEKGLSPMGLKSFVPHLTFMKLSRAPKLRKQGLKKIDPGLYESFNYHNFGDEVFHQIDLCSMVKKRQPNGYYHTEASIYFGNKFKDLSIQTALQRELKALQNKVKEIKEILSLPSTRANIFKELSLEQES